MNTPKEEFFDSDFDEEDTYDSQGNHCPGGMYDAGGHLIPERWADYADWVREYADWVRDSLRDK